MPTKVEWIFKISSVFGTFPSKDTIKLWKVSIFFKAFSNFKNTIKKYQKNIKNKDFIY